MVCVFQRENLILQAEGSVMGSKAEIRSPWVDLVPLRANAKGETFYRDFRFAPRRTAALVRSDGLLWWEDRPADEGWHVRKQIQRLGSRSRHTN